jgi:hypothetical protein
VRRRLASDEDAIGELQERKKLFNRAA